MGILFDCGYDYGVVLCGLCIYQNSTVYFSYPVIV